jgi:hypothetical protein
MMVSEREIWGAARALIERHGERAELQAARRADELLRAGDMEGATEWKRILIAVKVLLQDKPDGEPVH